MSWATAVNVVSVTVTVPLLAAAFAAFDTVTVYCALCWPWVKLPVCDLVMVSAGLGPLVEVNVAVTVSSALMVTVHVRAAVGAQLVLKLAKVKLAPAAAVSITWLLPAKVAVQVPGQVIPAGALVTVPVPVEVTVKDAAPMPERAIACVAGFALSVTVIVPVLATNAVGANATCSTQLAPTARVVGQGFAAMVKVPALIEMFEIVSGASPLFVRVTGRVAVALIGRFPNAKGLLEKLTAGFRSTSLIRLLNKSPTNMSP